MALIRIQGENERRNGIYYVYDNADIPLGEGGMGIVYHGWRCTETTNQRREVAIKFLFSDIPSHVIVRARREASVQLRNDSLVEMLGFVETTDRDELGQPVRRYHVISEYLHGVTLDKLLEGTVIDSRGNVIPFAQELYGKRQNDPYGFALTIVRSLLSGLIALHDAGYIHRDIDPSNIMVTAEGKIKLIDFGIAKKVTGDSTKESSYTVDGQFLGKPKYAAPELARGLVDSQNATTDLYAVGILLFQLLTGRVPFEGEMAEVLDMQINKKIPLKCIKQKEIKKVILTATQKSRSKRYQSAAEFRVAVDKLVPLQYPANELNVKKIAMSLSFAAVLCGAVVVVKPLVQDFKGNKDHEEEREPEEKQEDNINTYQKAVALLAGKETSEQGLEMLKALAGKDYESTFLLSRLYFSSEESVNIGSLSDSIMIFKENLGLAAKNEEAHRLLIEAVSINPTDYKSLFELGCDYKSKKRGALFNPDSAYIYLDRAKMFAKAAGDKEYETEIEKRLINLKPAK